MTFHKGRDVQGSLDRENETHHEERSTSMAETETKTTKTFSQILDEHGMSGKGLADKAGLDYNTVWRLTASVSEQTNIRLSTFVKIANALGEELAELADALGVEDVHIPDNDSPNREMRELTHIYKTLDPGSRNVLMECARGLMLRSFSLQSMKEDAFEDDADVTEEVAE